MRLHVAALGRALTRPACTVPAAAIAFWPAWRWYAARLGDGSDEPMGLIALVAAGVFLPRHGWFIARPARVLGAAAAVMAVYAALLPVLPPLIRAAVAVSVLALLVPRDPGRSFAPIYTLLLLSLPVIASLQYYLGFPVRAVIAWCGAWLMRCGGLEVTAEGTLWSGPHGDVLIDAPCSGIRMAWLAACMAAVLAAALRLTTRRYVALAMTSALLVFVANLARCVALYLMETKLIPTPPGGHDTVGLAAFALLVAGACTMAGRLAGGRSTAAGLALPAAPASKEAASSQRDSARGLVVGGAIATALFACAVVAAIRPAMHSGSSAISVADDAAPWPTEFEGRPLERVPLHRLEAEMARSFPGAIAAFTDGERRIIVRQITRPTRKVHPIADCLRAAGFTVTTVAARRDLEGRLWTALVAARGAQTLFVRERFSDGHGRSWTDASAWFWAAVWNLRNRGPWLAITVFSRSNTNLRQTTFAPHLERVPGRPSPALSPAHTTPQHLLSVSRSPRARTQSCLVRNTIAIALGGSVHTRLETGDAIVSRTARNSVRPGTAGAALPRRNPVAYGTRLRSPFAQDTATPSTAPRRNPVSYGTGLRRAPARGRERVRRNSVAYETQLRCRLARLRLQGGWGSWGAGWRDDAG